LNSKSLWWFLQCKLMLLNHNANLICPLCQVFLHLHCTVAVGTSASVSLQYKWNIVETRILNFFRSFNLFLRSSFTGRRDRILIHLWLTWLHHCESIKQWRGMHGLDLSIWKLRPFDSSHYLQMLIHFQSQTKFSCTINRLLLSYMFNLFYEQITRNGLRKQQYNMHFCFASTNPMKLFFLISWQSQISTNSHLFFLVFLQAQCSGMAQLHKEMHSFSLHSHT